MFRADISKSMAFREKRPTFSSQNDGIYRSNVSKHVSIENKEIVCLESDNPTRGEGPYSVVS